MTGQINKVKNLDCLATVKNSNNRYYNL